MKIKPVRIKLGEIRNPDCLLWWGYRLAYPLDSRFPNSVRWEIDQKKGDKISFYSDDKIAFGIFERIVKGEEFTAEIRHEIKGIHQLRVKTDKDTFYCEIKENDKSLSIECPREKVNKWAEEMLEISQIYRRAFYEEVLRRTLDGRIEGEEDIRFITT